MGRIDSNGAFLVSHNCIFTKTVMYDKPKSLYFWAFVVTAFAFSSIFYTILKPSFHTPNRVASIVANHDELLTQ